MFASMAGIVVGAGLIIGGLNVHDDNFADNDSRLCCEDRQSHDRREHLGYGMGIVGGAVLVLSVKELWDRHQGNPGALSGPSRAFWTPKSLGLQRRGRAVLGSAPDLRPREHPVRLDGARRGRTPLEGLAGFLLPLEPVGLSFDEGSTLVTTSLQYGALSWGGVKAR